MTASASHEILTAQGVDLSRPGEGRRIPILSGAGLCLRSGDIVALRGPSGSGKSAFLAALARLMPIDAGKLTLKGEPHDRISPPAWRASVSLTAQSPPPLAGTVRESILIPFRFKAQAARLPAEKKADISRRLDDFMDQAGLGSLDLNRPANELSGGEQARAAIVRALLTEPEVLLLDEPTANLDDASAGKILAMVGAFAGKGGAVLMALHRGAESETNAGGKMRRLEIRDGRLAEVSP